MESVGKRVKKVVKKHKRKNVRRSVEPPMFGELKVNLRYLRQKLQCLNYLFFFSVWQTTLFISSWILFGLPFFFFKSFYQYFSKSVVTFIYLCIFLLRLSSFMGFQPIWVSCSYLCLWNQNPLFNWELLIAPLFSVFYKSHLIYFQNYWVWF